MKVSIAASTLLGFSRLTQGLYINGKNLITQGQNISLQLQPESAELNSSFVPPSSQEIVDLPFPKLLQKRQNNGSGSGSEDGYDPFAIEDSESDSPVWQQNNVINRDSPRSDYDPFEIEDSPTNSPQAVVGNGISSDRSSSVSEESFFNSPVRDEDSLLPHGYRPSSSESSSLFEKSVEESPDRIIEESIERDSSGSGSRDTPPTPYFGGEYNSANDGPNVLGSPEPYIRDIEIEDPVVNSGFGADDLIGDISSFPSYGNQAPNPINRDFVTNLAIEEELQDNPTTNILIEEPVKDRATALLSSLAMEHPISQGFGSSDLIQSSGLGDLESGVIPPWSSRHILEAPVNSGEAANINPFDLGGNPSSSGGVGHSQTADNLAKVASQPEMAENLLVPTSQDVQNLEPKQSRGTNPQPLSPAEDIVGSRPTRKNIQESQDFVNTQEPTVESGKRPKEWPSEKKSRKDITTPQRLPPTEISRGAIPLFDMAWDEDGQPNEMELTGENTGRRYIRGDPRIRLEPYLKPTSKAVPSISEETAVELSERPLPKIVAPLVPEIAVAQGHGPLISEDIASSGLQPSNSRDMALSQPELGERQNDQVIGESFEKNILNRIRKKVSQRVDENAGRDVFKIAVSKCPRLQRLNVGSTSVAVRLERYLEFFDWWGKVDLSDTPYPRGMDIIETPGSMWDSTANYLDAFDREYGLGDYRNVGPDYDLIREDAINMRVVENWGANNTMGENREGYQNLGPEQILETASPLQTYGCDFFFYEGREICQLKATTAMMKARREHHGGKRGAPAPANLGRYLVTDGSYAGLSSRDYKVIDKLSVTRAGHKYLHWRFRACGLSSFHGNESNSYGMIDLYFDVMLNLGAPTPREIFKRALAPHFNVEILTPKGADWSDIAGTKIPGPDPYKKGIWNRGNSNVSIKVSSECFRDILKSPRFPDSCGLLWDESFRPMLSKRKPWKDMYAGPENRDMDGIPYFKDLEPIPLWQRATQVVAGVASRPDVFLSRTMVPILLEPPISLRGIAQEQKRREGKST
ncbi:hypothetical protein TWF718_001193 [Orbilia javanica]|uniref:Uncharacterized protein n=1 Tax=Orbilia javanica TaxID=47235 RepID=A0AAN8N0Y0_9PEZI